MTDYEYLTTVTDYEFEPAKEYADCYCTNPMTQPEKTQPFSWLDDLGWI